VIRAAFAALCILCGLHTAAAVEARVESKYFVTSDGVRLHVLEATPRAPLAPVIAFVPGWSMPAAIWQAQLGSLAKDHRVAALDPRGQGRSQIPPSGYTAERRADDIAEFVARYPKVVLVGWSLGALEALQYVVAHGQSKLAGLVLVDSSVGEPPIPPAGDFRGALERNRAQAIDLFVRAMFRTPRPDTEIAQLTSEALQLPLEASLALLAYPFPREHWRAAAHAVRVPLLYVVTPQFAEQASNLKRNRPQFEIAVFEDAGHALFVDEPERFNALLEDFVRRLSDR
jgi:microsomal epoxide hydrolase